jgi:tRNA1(Val) A37 N6-methylase TrmN6
MCVATRHRRTSVGGLPPDYLPAGMRCVELGAGVGLVGLALAAMGARVTITDIDKVLPLMRDNLAANGFDPARG